MSELPPPPPTWRRVLRLPHALGDELRWRVDLRVRRWRVRLRTGTPARRPELLRRAWVRTDPHAMARVFEGLRSWPPSPPPPRPSVGARADYRGVLTAGWRGDLRIGDVDLEDWLATELGGHIDQDGVRVELAVRVVADSGEDDADARTRAGASPAAGIELGDDDIGPARE